MFMIIETRNTTNISNYNGLGSKMHAYLTITALKRLAIKLCSPSYEGIHQSTETEWKFSWKKYFSLHTLINLFLLKTIKTFKTKKCLSTYEVASKGHRMNFAWKRKDWNAEN